MFSAVNLPRDPTLPHQVGVAPCQRAHSRLNLRKNVSGVHISLPGVRQALLGEQIVGPSAETDSTMPLCDLCLKIVGQEKFVDDPWTLSNKQSPSNRCEGLIRA